MCPNGKMSLSVDKNEMREALINVFNEVAYYFQKNSSTQLAEKMLESLFSSLTVKKFVEALQKKAI